MNGPSIGSSEQERQRLQGWLDSMAWELQEFAGDLHPDFRFDFSRESLAPLENWILQTFPDAAAATAWDARELTDRASRYVGEVLVRNLPLVWDISAAEKDIFRGLPVVRDRGWHIVDCPASLVTATAERRSGSLLRRVFDGIRETVLEMHPDFVPPPYEEVARPPFEVQRRMGERA